MSTTLESALRNALALLAFAGGCSSTSSSRTEDLYASLQSDVADRRSGSLPEATLRQRNLERAKQVRKMVEEGKLETSKEHFQAAVLLVETNDLENLKLGEQLAQKAAAEGERLAPRVAAEAIDKQLVWGHLPQRYGTQYEWIAVLAEWRLYPLDPKTTDAERRLVGVPPLAELYEGEKKLNAARAPK